MTKRCLSKTDVRAQRGIGVFGLTTAIGTTTASWFQPGVLLVITALCRRSSITLLAAARPVRPDFRRTAKILTLSNSQIEGQSGGSARRFEQLLSLEEVDLVDLRFIAKIA
ncbi:MAG: hypothetical protein AAFV54_02150 [Pseudomonadota bacterium]